MRSTVSAFALLVLVALPTARAALFSSFQRSSQAPLHVTGLALPAESQHATAQNVKKAITPDLSEFVKNLIEERNVPGISVGVVHLNGTSVTTELGAWGKMTEEGAAVVPETLFSIGSCSKAFLVSAMGILMEDFAHGRNVTALPPGLSTFNWDTKVQALLPNDWLLDDEWATKKVNVRDVLSHVSGLTRHDWSYFTNDTPLGLIKRMRFLKMKYELREHWSYNNLMYILGAHVISTYSGQSFQDFVKERIFRPLQMTSTSYRGAEADGSGFLSQSWNYEGRRIPYWFMGDATSNFVAGAGGIISNAIDMSKWAAMLLNKGVDPTSNRTVIPRETFDEMTTAHNIIKQSSEPTGTVSPLAGYGMGWVRTTVFGKEVVSHGGGLPGFLSDVRFLPNENIAVVAFVNSDGPHGVERTVPLRIIEDLFDLPHVVSQSALEAPTSHAPNTAFGPFPHLTTPSFSPSHALALDHANAKAPEPVPLIHYEGTYDDPGYGELDICAPTSTVYWCRRILADWASISPNGTLDPGTLYGYSWRRFWHTHFKLRHTSTSPPAGAGDDGQDIEAFTLTVGTIFPNGFGRDRTPFVYQMDMNAEIGVECVVERDAGDGTPQVVGCGLEGLEGEPGTGETPQERADVWFQKTNS